MKYLAMIAVLMTLTVVPAFANQHDTQPVLARTSTAQRAWAQLVAGRIQSALDAEPFAGKECKGDDCTASAH